MNRHNNHGTAGSLLAVATFISFAVLAEANLPTRTVVLYPVGDSMVRYSQPDTAFPSESLLTWYQDTENNEYAKSYVQWQLPDDCDPRFITGAKFRVWVTDTQTRGTVDFYGVLDGVTTANPETYTFNTAPGLEKDPTKWIAGSINGHFDSATARHLGGIHNNDFLVSPTGPYEAVSNVNFGDSLQLEWLRSLDGRIATAFFSARHAIASGLNHKSWFASREHPDYPGPRLEISYISSHAYADLDGNGVVDFNDFALLAGDWLRSAEPGVYPGDLSRDGQVGLADLQIFVTAWLKGTDILASMEGPLDSFLAPTFFDKQILFDELDDDGQVREPYLAVAVDGTVLALRNHWNRQTGSGRLRRSEDGGQSWGQIIQVPFGAMDSNMIVDEITGNIMSVRMVRSPVDTLFRSRDHGKTWNQESLTLIPNEIMETKIRGTDYYIHASASEDGITLRHGEHKGRLIVAATFRPIAEEHPSDRDPADAIYNCAIYSDDRGVTWQVSGLFPEGYTEEGALAELQDGRLYYNSRSCSGYYASTFARPLEPEETVRRQAWSYDGGQHWEDLAVVWTLPDGGGYNKGYGMKGGLVRLPVKDRDILLYSNSDTGGGAREKVTVWASFDGAETWPIKRLVEGGPSAYSCLAAGRPGTPSEGQIYLFFEGAQTGCYHAMQIARFNLSWVLEGVLTGDGQVPQWVYP